MEWEGTEKRTRRRRKEAGMGRAFMRMCNEEVTLGTLCRVRQGQSYVSMRLRAGPRSECACVVLEAPKGNTTSMIIPETLACSAKALICEASPVSWGGHGQLGVAIHLGTYFLLIVAFVLLLF